MDGMNAKTHPPIEVAIVAVPETGGGAFYGMVDMLSAAGTLWSDLVGAVPPKALFRTRVVGCRRDAFRCTHGVPIVPDCSIEDALDPEVVVVPELWWPPGTGPTDAYPELSAWLRECHARGSMIYSSCTGAILLAASGLLDGRTATSHWAYEGHFQERFDSVDFVSGSSLVAADAEGHIVTASGSTSWQDLALHIVARHCGAQEALRLAKGSLLRWHEEGQRPYTALVQRRTHDDAIVAAVEGWLEVNLARNNALGGAVAFSGLAERTLKRRFKRATGTSLIDRIQCLRIEEAKHRLEMGNEPVEDISLAVGYENTSFFGRLFKRLTGTTPGTYRRMFQPIARAGTMPSPVS
jgi:transcriptional regulator GlxA family with amidase domain